MKLNRLSWILVPALAVSGLNGAPPTEGDLGIAIPGASFARFATPDSMALAAQGGAVVVDGRVPSILLETTPAYIFLPSQTIGLRLTHDPKGLASAATVYLYRQNRTTGEREYYSAALKGFAPAGEQRDLFGAGTTPVAVNLPKLTDFVLFGDGGALGAALPVGSTAVGRYQFVLEVRDALGSGVVSRGNAMYSVVSAVETISGNITASRTLTADKAYLLRGAVFVQEPATLTIDRGTVLLGEGSSKGTLVVARGAKLVAEGTAAQPIIMTSDRPVGQRSTANWGGLILNGRAQFNSPDGLGAGEGNTGSFGGGSSPVNTDSSGTLRYVRVEFAGIEFSPENELNGIAFQGTGSGTVVENIQVHYNEDDGIEFFGGSTNAKYVILTGIGDDNLDWTGGWNGKVQFLLAVQGKEKGNRGIEADNSENNNDAAPRSTPQVYNFTLIGNRPAGASELEGVVLRRGTAGILRNGITSGWPNQMVDVRDAATQAQGGNGNLVVDNSIFALTSYQDGGFGTNANGQFTKTFVRTTMKNNRFTDALLTDPAEITMPNAQPRAGSPARDGRFVRTPPDDGFFDTSVNFVGAVGDWNWPLAGWATFSRN